MAKCRELTRCSAQTAVSTGCFTSCTPGSPRRPEAVSSKPQIEVTPALAATIRVGASPSYSRARFRSHEAARSRKLPRKDSKSFFCGELRCCPKAQALSFHAAKREQEAWTRDLDSGVRREVGDATGRNVWRSQAVSRATGEMARMNRAGLLLWGISDGSLLSRVLGDGILGVIYQPSMLTFLGSWRRRCSRGMFSGVESV
jgi:hypothetical protein